MNEIEKPREYVTSLIHTKPWCDINGNVTEIVRCKDCKHRLNGADGMLCVSPMGNEIVSVTPDHFCACGVGDSHHSMSQKIL